MKDKTCQEHSIRYHTWYGKEMYMKHNGEQTESRNTRQNIKASTHTIRTVNRAKTDIQIQEYKGYDGN